MSTVSADAAESEVHMRVHEFYISLYISEIFLFRFVHFEIRRISNP